MSCVLFCFVTNKRKEKCFIIPLSLLLSLPSFLCLHVYLVAVLFKKSLIAQPLWLSG